MKEPSAQPAPRQSTQVRSKLWALDDARNSALYRDLLAEHGLSHSALNWGSRESQQKRFKVITEAGITPGSSLLDVGCGTGDLLEYLRVCRYRCDYRGIDITPEMIVACRKRFPQDTFNQVNLIELDAVQLSPWESDIVVASGIFYARQEQPAEFMDEMIARLFSITRKTLIFNSLSDWAENASDNYEFRADPLRVLDFCRRLSTRTVLRHDYHPADFTIYVRR
jgi:SAM-dependent methyltransferase